MVPHREMFSFLLVMICSCIVDGESVTLVGSSIILLRSKRFNTSLYDLRILVLMENLKSMLKSHKIYI
jgi:hypothetical protein